MHQQRTAHAIIRTKRCAIGIPLGSGLAYLVWAGCAVDCINVRCEQRAVMVLGACVNVQVVGLIQPSSAKQMLG
tara:strand:+ start:1621 stop:1842 length:222 start_codon:yes stop_codon:yes gene_type:complete